MKRSLSIPILVAGLLAFSSCMSQSVLESWGTNSMSVGSSAGSSSAGSTYSSVYKVIYNGNMNTGGSVPVDSGLYYYGDYVSVRANTGNLVKTGYLFGGWNTQSNGSGNTYNYYSDSSYQFTMGSSNVTLYALWLAVYPVTYFTNGSTGGIAPADTNSYTNGQNFTVLSNTGNLVKTGYLLSGWNTQPNGGGKTYTNWQQVAMGNTNVNLYPLWTVFFPTITVSNGPNGSVNPSGTVTNTYGSGTNLTITANSGHVIVNVTVDGVSKGAISTVTFNNIVSNHIIVAYFSPAALGFLGGGVNGWQTGSVTSGNSLSFNNPNGVFVDSSGNIYVADSMNNRISKWTSNGTAPEWLGNEVTGWQGGNSTTAAATAGSDKNSFSYPTGVFVDGSGNIYVADCTNNRISKWSNNGKAIGWIGGGENTWQNVSTCPAGADYQSFYCPSSVFVDNSGNIYVADSMNNRISKWNNSGTAIGWIGNSSNGWQNNASTIYKGVDYQSFFDPTGVYVDALGNIYIADSGNNRICKWDSNGTAIGWIGGGTSGWQTGPAPASPGYDFQSFYMTWTAYDYNFDPVGWYTGVSGIFVDASSNIYIADNGNNRISKWRY
jgi:hypothetical protein